MCRTSSASSASARARRQPSGPSARGSWTFEVRPAPGRGGARLPEDGGPRPCLLRRATGILFGVESAFELTPLELEAGSGGPAVSVLEGGAARVDARLSPPVRPAGLVPRRWAVHSLLESHDLPVALLVAPPGYGKTTVLSEWAERDARPFAWVRLDA